MLFSFYRQLLKFFFLHFFKAQIYFNKLSKKKKSVIFFPLFFPIWKAEKNGGPGRKHHLSSFSLLSFYSLFSPLTFPSLIFYNIPFTHQPNITLTLVPNSQQPKCKIHQSFNFFFNFWKRVKHITFEFYIKKKKNYLIRDSFTYRGRNH